MSRWTGCCDHRAIPTDEVLHRYSAEQLAQADALVFGRVTYEMTEAAWRPSAHPKDTPFETGEMRAIIPVGGMLPVV